MNEKITSWDEFSNAITAGLESAKVVELQVSGLSESIGADTCKASVDALIIDGGEPTIVELRDGPERHGEIGLRGASSVECSLLCSNGLNKIRIKKWKKKDFLTFPEFFELDPTPFKAIKERLRHPVDDYIIAAALVGLCSEQLLVLHGPSGTGKSTFAKDLADALCAVFTMCEVQSNWMDKSELLGYYVPMDGGFYVETDFLHAVLAAKDDYDKYDEEAPLHIICLDEMNLASVEYYYATFLSLMQRDKGDRMLNLLPPNIEATGQLERYASFNLPPNLRFIGTLNMDDTTRSLSPKVIDRSVMIDFSNNDAKGKSEGGSVAAQWRLFDPENNKAANDLSFPKMKGNKRFYAFLEHASDTYDNWRIPPNVPIEELVILTKILPTLEDEHFEGTDEAEAKTKIEEQLDLSNVDELERVNKKIAEIAEHAAKKHLITYFCERR